MVTPRLPKLIGEPIKRREDPALLTGRGTFVDDMQLPRMLHMAIVRSPYAHARITRLDTSAASKAPGVATVLTHDYVRERSETYPVAGQIPGMHIPPRWSLAGETVNFVGEPVVAVIASDRYTAADAAELVEVDYEELPVITDPEKAIEDGSPLVHEAIGTNVCVVSPIGDAAATDRAFAEADVVVRQRMINQRLIPNAIEPRGAIAEYAPGPETLTLWTSTQIPHLVKFLLAATVRFPEHKLRVVAPDVGGGFGSKLNIYAEEFLVSLASISLERPVKWIEERRENYLATTHGRDIIGHIEIAAKRDGTITGYRARLVVDIGAYQQLLTAAIPTLTALMLTGVYQIPALAGEIVEVFTNKTPTDAYRGAGRPESTYFIERAVDLLAAELKMDPVEFRRKNFIPKDAFPYTTGGGVSYDSGDYEPALNRALEMGDYPALRREQERLRQEGRYLGIGFSTYVEISGLGPSAALPAGGWEVGEVRVERTGKITVYTGVSPHGQGQGTAFAQIVAEEFGVGIDDVTVIHGDTAQVSAGIGTFGSRALVLGGSAIVMSVEKIKEKAKRFAAHEMEARPEDMVFDHGRIYVEGKPDSALTLAEIATLAYNATNLPPDTEPGLEATSYFEPENFTFPFGTQIAVVEVDAESGKIDLQRFISVDDCGNVINPMLVEGQIQGGVAQGISQALFEEAVYDEEGQLLSGSLMDYNVPTADQFPNFELDRTVTTTPVNPLGAKGVGEAGTIGATPAVVNAVVDALAPFGVRHIDMLLRPEKIWRAMQAGKGSAS